MTSQGKGEIFCGMDLVYDSFCPQCFHAFFTVFDEGFCAKTRVVDMLNEILYSSQNRFIVFSLGGCV